MDKLKILIEKYRNDSIIPELVVNSISNMQNIKSEYLKNKSKKYKKAIVELLEEEIYRVIFLE